MTSKKRAETLELLLNAFRNIKLEMGDDERAYFHEVLDVFITKTYGEENPENQWWRKLVV